MTFLWKSGREKEKEKEYKRRERSGAERKLTTGERRIFFFSLLSPRPLALLPRSSSLARGRLPFVPCLDFLLFTLSTYSSSATSTSAALWLSPAETCSALQRLSRRREDEEEKDPFRLPCPPPSRSSSPPPPPPPPPPPLLLRPRGRFSTLSKEKEPGAASRAAARVLPRRGTQPWGRPAFRERRRRERG